MSTRTVNFSAGPAALPEPVLERAKESIWDLAGTGIGILEHSHRGPAFTEVLENTVARCRKLANIGDDYEILFLQGGASTQFFMIPMNWLDGTATADYIHTGTWSKKAIAEAKRFGNVHVAASSEVDKFAHIPDSLQWSEQASYAHYTSNNTISGTQFAQTPSAPAGVPLICDASSDIFSRPIDVSAHGMIYAGAQKNLGPSGLALVIVRKDLVERGKEDLPTMLQYRTHAKAGSCFNTPPTFGIYIMGEVFQWIDEQGGLAAMQKRNEAKSKLLYDALDESEIFSGTARADSRSHMNVTFRAKDPEQDARFLALAAEAKLSGLKGHRSVGGMRASIYNAMEISGVEKLIEVMKDFEGRER